MNAHDSHGNDPSASADDRHDAPSDAPLSAQSKTPSAAQSGEPLASLRVDRVFEGGDLDCGSGLVLMIRESMLGVPIGGILELRSREPSVRGDLPPWCRMSGHEYLGTLEEEAGAERHFVRRGEKSQSDAGALEADKERARQYEWRARVRVTGPLRETVYCRNFSFPVGQPASFEERDEHPSAVEYLIGAVGSDVAAVFATECSRQSIALDDVEVTVRAKIEDPMAILGLSSGSPRVSRIELKCFASTGAPESLVRAAWSAALERSPLIATLRPAMELDLKLALV